jgi:hypothetical protein
MKMPTQTTPSRTLQLAAIYNLVWGSLVVLLPERSFLWAGFDELPRYPQLWQCIGMIVGVYGIGYAIAAYDYIRHWPIVLVGLLGKVCGPIGFLQAAIAGELPWMMFRCIVFNDLIWWVPFGVILWRCFRETHGLNQEATPVRM